MKKVLLTGMMVCLTASMALAAGVNITWNPNNYNCLSSAVVNTDWDCATVPGANDGFHNIVLSFMPSKAIVGFNGVSAVIDGQTPGDVPAWWQMFNDGSCRAASIVPGAPPSAPTAPCLGNSTTKLWSAGTPAGGLSAYQTTLYPPPAPLPAPAANRFRIKLGYATASNRALPLVITTQYNTFNLTIDTFGSAVEEAAGVTDPCAGCAVGATLVLNEMYIVGSVDDDTMTTPISNQCITWQGGAGTGVCAATPARNTTWGQVKSLYR